MGTAAGPRSLSQAPVRTAHPRVHNFTIRLSDGKPNTNRVCRQTQSRRSSFRISASINLTTTATPRNPRRIKKTRNHAAAGTGGICPTAAKFNNKHGLRNTSDSDPVAKEVGSSVARCYLGQAKTEWAKKGSSSISKAPSRLKRKFAIKRLTGSACR